MEAVVPAAAGQGASADPAPGAPAAVDVSVIVPCYNTERFLVQALASALANDRVALEVIAVNDGSTDGSLLCMQAAACVDGRVRVIDKPNGGYGSAVNAGLAAARGTWVAILEPDDWVEPHMYDTLVEFARTFDPAPDVVKGPYWRIWMPETPKQRRYHCSYHGRVRPPRQPFTLAECPRLIQHHPSIWSAIYRRGFLDERGIRMREVPGAGWVDNPWLVETLAAAQRIVYLDEPFYNYREDLPGSSSVGRTVGLSIERWNDMADVLERLDVRDAGIWQSLDTVGFRYVSAAIGQGAMTDPDLRQAVCSLFARMRAEDIVALGNVDPGMRRRALEWGGHGSAALDPLPYAAALAREFGYCWRENGPAFAMSRVGVFFQRRFQRTAANPTQTRSASI